MAKKLKYDEILMIFLGKFITQNLLVVTKLLFSQLL